MLTPPWKPEAWPGVWGREKQPLKDHSFKRNYLSQGKEMRRRLVCFPGRGEIRGDDGRALSRMDGNQASSDAGSPASPIPQAWVLVPKTRALDR